MSPYITLGLFAAMFAFAGFHRLVARRIEVQYGDAASPSTVFVHDGTWLGWRQMLTGSNWRIARAFAALVG